MRERGSFVRSLVLLSFFAACGAPPGPSGTTGTSGNGPKNGTTGSTDGGDSGDSTGSTTGDANQYLPHEGLPGSVHVEFAIPRNGAQPSFSALPFPSELRRTATGAVDWSSFPKADAWVVDKYVAEAAATVRDFSVAQTAYFKFSGAVPVAGLPTTPEASMSVLSGVFLLDVDPASPERGQLWPIHFRTYDRAYEYVEKNVLAAKPAPGFVLRSGTLYAYVVRRDAGDLGTEDDFEFTKWTAPRDDADEEAARLLHADTFDFLQSLEVARADVAAIALFRTGVPEATGLKLLEVIEGLSGANAPRITDVMWKEISPSLTSKTWEIEGHYCTPNFQSQPEKAPYGEQQGGTFVYDSNGRPQLVPIPSNATFASNACAPLMHARFVISIPKTPMPSGGWPLVVTGHGTSGDATSSIHDIHFSGAAADAGMATVATDAPLHGSASDIGKRPGSQSPVVLSVSGLTIPLPGMGITAAMLFYNPVNPGAGRDNARQAMADQMVLFRLIAATDFSGLLASDASKTAPRFDASKLYLAGHSQGSQTTATQAAIDPLSKGILLSGCGGDIRYGILRRTKPFELKSILSSLTGMDDGELDEFHPAMMLAQAIADPVDPQSYARLYREPLAGHVRQSVLHYIGIGDQLNPNESGNALAIALRGTHITPVLASIDHVDVFGLGEGNEVQGNYDDATIAFQQFRPPAGTDGHYVLTETAAAISATQRFFAAIRSAVAPVFAAD